MPHASASPRHGGPPTLVEGLHVPWAIGGPRIEADGRLVERAPEWPTGDVPAIRLWDTRTAWLNLEPARGVWDWSTLDAHIAQASRHGTADLTLVLWGTPAWAASSLDAQDAAWLGPGSAAPPRSLADWEVYVRAVTTRYRGVIGAYELGNEVNVPAFWRGSSAELTAMVVSAARIIREVDPTATIVAPSVATSGSGEASLAKSLWRSWAEAPLDALAVHWYPAAGADPATLRTTAVALHAAAKRAGRGSLPLWFTEAGFRATATSPPDARPLIARAVRALDAVADETRTERLYWYAWSDLPIGDLIPLPSDRPLDASHTLRHRRADRPFPAAQ